MVGSINGGYTGGGKALYGARRERERGGRRRWRRKRVREEVMIRELANTSRGMVREEVMGIRLANRGSRGAWVRRCGGGDVLESGRGAKWELCAARKRGARKSKVADFGLGCAVVRGEKAHVGITPMPP
jgi:hypothetical protein